MSHEDSRTCTLHSRARILGYMFPRTPGGYDYDDDVRQRTGNIRPCQVRILDLSTWIFVKFFIADALRSPSSWKKSHAECSIEPRDHGRRRAEFRGHPERPDGARPWGRDARGTGHRREVTVPDFVNGARERDRRESSLDVSDEARTGTDLQEPVPRRPIA